MASKVVDIVSPLSLSPFHSLLAPFLQLLIFCSHVSDSLLSSRPANLRVHAFALGGRCFCMAGIDEGPGMIHPKVGPHVTLLGCIVTDAAVSLRSLQFALTYAVDRSFNSISVDRDMSTNDTRRCTSRSGTSSRASHRSSRSLSCATARARPSS